jgi:surfactin synthase thioesterase subunit
MAIRRGTPVFERDGGESVHTRPDGKRIRLLCLPFAGGGAGFFKAWRRLGDSPLVDYIGIQLPGRENLIRRPPATTVSEAVEAVLPDVQQELAVPGSVCLFGHSSGAVIAFELARRLDELAPGRIDRLFVSGSAAPWAGRPGRATGLPDDEFIAAVQTFAGATHTALAEPRLRGVLLPPLRADVEMHEAYRVAYGTAVGVPITAIRGADDALISNAAVAEWAQATRADFESAELPGGHMYLTDRRIELSALVAASIRRAGRG